MDKEIPSIFFMSDAIYVAWQNVFLLQRADDSRWYLPPQDGTLKEANHLSW